MSRIDIRRTLAMGIQGLLEDPSRLPLPPRPYQVESLESTVRWLEDAEGTRRAYISHATGLGKTYLFASMVAAVPDLRILIIVPTKVLLVQTARVIARYTRGMLGHLSSLNHITDSSGDEVIAVRGMDASAVVLTTDASFNKRAEQIREAFDPQVILRDECHWGYVEKALTGLESFSEAVIIGFSATPDFLTNSMIGGYTPVTLDNGQVLYGSRDKFADTHFQTCLDRRGLRWGIENGWLAPMAWGRIEFDILLKDVPVVEGMNGPDFDEGELHQMMQKHWSVMCETVSRLYQNPDYDLPNRQVYAVCPTIKEAEELAEAIALLGISTACVTGQTPDIHRDIILEAYKNNEIRLITSVMVLREGWDAPNAEVCLMLRPTKSRVLYEQIIGRALRLADDGHSHKVALILDAHFQGDDFSPLSAPELYAKPGDEVKMNDILIGSRSQNEGINIPVDSPYLPKGVQPRIIVIDEYKAAVKYQRANKDGLLSLNGAIYAHTEALKRMLKIGCRAIEERIEKNNISSVEAETYLRRITRFYPISEVRDACSSLLEDLQTADVHGFIEVDGEKWGSIAAIAKVLNTDMTTTRKRLKQLVAHSGKGHSGKIISFYKLLDAKQVCIDLFEELPGANEEGFVTLEGEEWGDLKSIAVRLNLVKESVRLRAHGLQARKCLKGNGHRASIYRLADVRNACLDLLNDIPCADTKGIIEVHGEKWIDLQSFVKQNELVNESVRLRVKDLLTIKGQKVNGQRVDFYQVTQLQKACLNLLEDLPVANEKGFVHLKGEEWATLGVLARTLGRSFNWIKARSSGRESIRAFAKSRQVLDHYRLADFA